MSKITKEIDVKIPASGRNDPCPCGSGRKFKKCCLERLEFDSPGRGAEAASADLRRAMQGMRFGSLAKVQAYVEPGDILAASAYIYELGTSGSIHTGA